MVIIPEAERGPSNEGPDILENNRRAAVMRVLKGSIECSGRKSVTLRAKETLVLHTDPRMNNAVMQASTRDCGTETKWAPAPVSESVTAALSRFSIDHIEKKSMRTSVTFRTSPLEPDGQTWPIDGTK